MRHRMSLQLAPLPNAVDPTARHPSADDADALALLMLDAYRGTIDDHEGSTLGDARAEIRETLRGSYGDFLPACSDVVERDGRLVAATLVTRYEGVPFLSFAMTDPAWKRRGLARAGLCRAINALVALGETELRLVVTEGNPAEGLYASMGFRRVA
jgi:ribosomal protein S18 acetylase RimI-like enzyme